MYLCSTKKISTTSLHKVLNKQSRIILNNSKSDESFSNKELDFDEEENLNTNNNNSNDRNVNLRLRKSLSTSDNELSNDLCKTVKKRIIYTKEFLLNLNLRENSNAYPINLLPNLENSEVFWDPEKYFESIKGSEFCNKKDDESIVKKNNLPRQINLEKVTCMFNFGVFQSNYILKPGVLVDVTLCSLITKNDLYVNLLSMKGAYQQLSSILNVYCNNNLLNYLNVNMNNLKNDEIFLAFYGNIWHRVYMVENLTVENLKLKVCCIDNGKEFEACFFMPCPKDLANIPGFGLNVSLAGIKKELDLRVLNEFINKNNNFKMKIIYFDKSKSKYFVELFNDQKISLNYLLNPKFQKEIFNQQNDDLNNFKK